MSAEGGKAFQMVVDVVEGVTPRDTGYAESPTFEYLQGYTEGDVKGLDSPTRKFILALTGQRSLGGPLGPPTKPFEVTEVWELRIAYLQGEDSKLLQQVIIDDINEIGADLMTPNNWDEPTTRVSDVDVGEYVPVFDDEENGAAVVLIPIPVTYRPEFT